MTDNGARKPTLRIDTVDHGPAASWLTLSGEADVATLDELDEALARIHLVGAQSVHFHLADLRFCDLPTLRRLRRFAADARQAGHDVMTCRPSGCVRRIAGLLDCRHDLGVL